MFANLISWQEIASGWVVVVVGPDEINRFRDAERLLVFALRSPAQLQQSTPNHLPTPTTRRLYTKIPPIATGILDERSAKYRKVKKWTYFKYRYIYVYGATSTLSSEAKLDGSTKRACIRGRGE